MLIVKKITSILFWALFFFSIFSLSFIFIFKVIPDLENEIIKNAAIAFFGAFFAFSLVKFGEFTNRIRKRNVEHFNCLVKIEHILNRAIYSIDKNMQFHKNNLEALKRNDILTYSFFDIYVNHDLLVDLLNIDFINDLFVFFADLESANNDMKTIKNMYEELKMFLANRIITGEIFKINLQISGDYMKKILFFLINAKERAIRLFAIDRLLSKEIKRKSFLFGPHARKKYIKNFDKLIKEEIKIVKKEVRKSEIESQEEIDKMEEEIKKNQSEIR